MSLNSYTWHAAAEVFCTADGKRLHPSHGSVFYRKEEIDAALAAERQANTELAMRERKAEADLADANHALILANNNANAFRRVAEQRQGERDGYAALLRVIIEAWDYSETGQMDGQSIEMARAALEGWAPEQDGKTRRCSECADGTTGHWSAATAARNASSTSAAGGDRSRSLMTGGSYCAGCRQP